MFCRNLPNMVAQILVLMLFHIVKTISISVTKILIKCVTKTGQLSLFIWKAQRPVLLYI